MNRKYALNVALGLICKMDCVVGTVSGMSEEDVTNVLYIVNSWISRINALSALMDLFYLDHLLISVAQQEKFLCRMTPLKLGSVRLLPLQV